MCWRVHGPGLVVQRRRSGKRFHFTWNRRKKSRWFHSSSRFRNMYTHVSRRRRGKGGRVIVVRVTNVLLLASYYNYRRTANSLPIIRVCRFGNNVRRQGHPGSPPPRWYRCAPVLVRCRYFSPSPLPASGRDTVKNNKNCREKKTNNIVIIIYLYIPVYTCI